MKASLGAGQGNPLEDFDLISGFSVIPAKAGIQSILGGSYGKAWIPAFAGMTVFPWKEFQAFKRLHFVQLRRAEPDHPARAASGETSVKSVSQSVKSVATLPSAV